MTSAPLTVYAKLEGLNPGWNVNDRTAYNVIVKGYRSEGDKARYCWTHLLGSFAIESRKTIVAALAHFETSRVLVQGIFLYDNMDRPRARVG